MASVPAGAYMVTAKTTLAQTDNANAAYQVTCTLVAGGATDTAEAEVGRQKEGAAIATIHLQLVHSFAVAGSVVLSCNSPGSFQVAARHTTIVAVKVDTVTRTAVTG
jgi:hypothetical protein